MQYTPEEIQKLRCYTIYFWGHDEDYVRVTPRQACSIKMAIKNDLKYFEIGRDLYMIKDVKRIEYDKSMFAVDRINDSSNLIEGATFEMLGTDYYLKDSKLLELPEC
jgi:hypothetical protein